MNASKFISPIRSQLLLALATLSLPAFSYAGTYTNNFSSPDLVGAALYGDDGDASAGVIEGGVLKLTKAEFGSKTAAFIVEDLDSGAAVSSFTATFRLLIGGGSGADGFSFSFGPDLPDGGISEEGSGTGLIVAFDSYDNGNAEAPAIDLKIGGSDDASVVASTKITPRSALAQNQYVPVRINLDPDGTVDVSYGDRVIYTNLYTRFTATPGRFALGARTGGSADNHFVDDLRITTSTGPQTLPTRPLIIANSPSGAGVAPDAAIAFSIQDFNSQVNQSSIRVLLNGTAVTPTINKAGDTTTVEFKPAAPYSPSSTNTVQLIYADTATPSVTSTNQFTFQVIAYNNVTLPATALFSENFDSVAEGSLPNGWTQTNLTTSINAGIDFGDPNSDAYLGWVVIPRSRLEGDPFDARRLNVAPGFLNGRAVTNLVEGNLVYAESDNRGGNQIQTLFSPTFNLAGKTDVHLFFHSIYEQNQDSLGAVEYSADNGTTWNPVLIMLDDPDIVRTNGMIDPVATLTNRHTDTPEVDDGNGGTRRTAFGEFLGGKDFANYASVITARVNDNATESKRIELFRLPKADNQANVRIRFVQAGTGSWYFGIDNFGLYSIPTSTDRPNLSVAKSSDRQATLSWPANVSGFVLQSTDSLGTPNWQPVGGVTGNSITIDTNVGTRFYRLVRQ